MLGQLRRHRETIGLWLLAITFAAACVLLGRWQLHLYQDKHGRAALVAAGVVSWIAFQAFQNIGMTVGIMPITGLPLPFLSYGGSAMFANLVAIGLLENVALSTPRR